MGYVVVFLAGAAFGVTGVIVWALAAAGKQHREDE